MSRSAVVLHLFRGVHPVLTSIATSMHWTNSITSITTDGSFWNATYFETYCDTSRMARLHYTLA